MVRTRCFHRCGPGSVPGWEAKIPQAEWLGKGGGESKYIYTHTHIYIYTHTHTYTHTHIYVCVKGLL